jgi:hypothetical protein
MSPAPISMARLCAGPVPAPTVATSEPAANLLPDPQSVFVAPGDLGAAIAALAVENGVAERWVAREARQADEARTRSEGAAEVKALHDEASSMRLEACLDVGITVAGAVVGAVTGGAGELLAKAGTCLVDGWLHADQKDDEATAKGHEAASSDAKSAAQDAHDNLSAGDAFIKAAIDFYQEYVATRGQTENTAARRA